MRLASSRTKPQQQARLVAEKPWRVEPVKIVGVKTKNKEHIEIGRAFDEDDDWLDGFTITVANNYDKTITAMTINMVFRREAGDTRPPVAKELHFGPSPIAREYLNRDPNKVIRVGKTGDLYLSPHNYQILKRNFEQTGYPVSIRRVELVITEVGFEDGSLFDSGTFYIQDPANPNDPTKKIPARLPGAENQKTRSPPEPNHPLTGVSFLNASLNTPNPSQISLTFANSIQSENCRQKVDPNRTPYCSTECTVRRDSTDPFAMGAYDTVRRSVVRW